MDYYLKTRNNPRMTEKKVSFSIFQSWQDLKSDRNNFFLFLETIRFVIMGAVVFGNLLLIASSLPISNPTFIEKNLKIVNTIFIGNSYLIIQMFFIISGLLLYIKIRRLYESCSFGSIFWKCVAGRYVRFVISFFDFEFSKLGYFQQDNAIFAVFHFV